MKQRVAISLTFSVDLDMVPGWGHQAEDWVNFIHSELSRNSHYAPEVAIHSVDVGNYEFDFDKGWIRPTLSSTDGRSS
jgi:hypothetical protein